MLFAQPAGWLLLWFLSCSSAWGFGLGDLRVSSVAGDPLRAEVRLLAVRPGDVDGATAALASRGAFERAGLARPPLLEALSFRAVERADGSAVIEIISAEPLAETTLNFLLEVQWSRGRLLREYLLVLEGPLAAEPAGIPQIPSSEPEPEPLVPTVEPLPAVTESEGVRTYTTVANDTLGGVARRNMPAAPSGTINIEQMMLAMLRLNPEAFVGNNINNMHKGAVLRIPDLQEITRLGQGEAIAEAARQYDEWRRFRDSFAEQQPETVAEAEVAPAAPEPLEPEVVEPEVSDGRLEIVTNIQTQPVSESGSAIGGTGDSTLKTELALTRELAQTRAKQIEALEDQLRRMEQRLVKNERLMSLQATELADLQQQVTAPVAPKEETLQPAEPASPQAQATDIVSQLLFGKWQWLLGAVFLLLCVYLLILIWRAVRTPLVTVAPPTGHKLRAVDSGFDIQLDSRPDPELNDIVSKR